MSSRRIHVEAYGCSASLADSEMIAGILAAEGYQLVEDEDQADLNLIVTCTVKSTTEDRMKYRITELSRHGTPLVVAGCMPATEPHVIEKINPRASQLGPQSIQHTLRVVKETLEGGRTVAVRDSKLPKVGLPRVRANPVVAVVEIANGCLNSCTFCQVKLAKGGLVSYRAGPIVAEIRRAVQEGCREIWLTSTDNGAYGRDLRSNLAELLELVSDIEGSFMVRVGMMNPAHVTSMLDELVSAYLHPKVFKFLHLPVQTGSNRLLSLMKRGHTVEDFMHIVDTFRKVLPEITLSTDLIVGFPTESEADFDLTLDLLGSVKPDVVNLSRYGARPGTKAAQMPQLDRGVIGERSATAHRRIKEIQLERNRRWIGWRGKALVDEEVREAMLARNYAYKPIVLREGLGLGSTADVLIMNASAACLVGRFAPSAP